MLAINQFFASVYGVDSNIESSLESSANALNTAFLDSINLDIKAIILCVNADNFDTFNKSEIFREILENLESSNENSASLDSKKIDSKSADSIKNLDSIKLAQEYILSHLDSSDLRGLKPYITRLNAVEILNNASARNLINCFNQIAKSLESKNKSPKKVLNLNALKDELESIYKNLLSLNLTPQFYANLEKIKNNMANNKFSIGITGVLSAGKSTFLNALLGSEILGTSSIPETANLTILRYSQTQKARVHFWSKSEWEEILESSKYDKSLAAFVKQSENLFGEKLSEYVTQSSKIIDIDLKELPIYTSANDPSKLCNLVKEVELFSDLKFLQNGVEIVDTPGLDDPVIKREEITKSYIANCDLLVHVMNASCAATQIDIDFILNALLTQNISRLLVILTRIDLISESDLEKCLEYTKSSLEVQLKKANISNLDSILNRITFIPVASFLALMWRIGQENLAQAKGYNLEKTGILDVEKYLSDVLLGENSLKMKDILFLAYRGFLKQCLLQIETLELESKILNASKSNIDSMLKELENENDELLKKLDSKNDELNKKSKELESFLQSMQNFVQKSLQKEQEKIASRLLDDAKYEYEKGGKPARERLDSILLQGFEDCFSDLSREYQYKISRKIQGLIEEFVADFSSIADSKLSAPKFDFSAPKDEIKRMLFSVQNAVYDAIASHNKSSFLKLSSSLNSIFSQNFDSFNDIIKEKNKSVESALISFFEASANLQKEALKAQIDAKNALIKSTLQKRDDPNNEKLKEKINSQLHELPLIINELKYVCEELG